MLKLLRSTLLSPMALVAFALACFSVSSVRGEGSSPDFSCVIWGEIPYDEIFYPDGKKLETLELRSGRRSDVYSMKRSETFDLYIKTVGEDGKIGARLVGRTTFPPESKRMLFLIAKVTDKDGLPLSILGIEDSLTAFPSGTFRFANFTNTPMNVTLGDVSERLMPRQIEVFRVKMPAKGGIMSCVVRDEAGKAIFARRLLGQPRTREMVFIAPSGNADGGLRALIIPEILRGKVKPIESSE